MAAGARVGASDDVGFWDELVTNVRLRELSEAESVHRARMMRLLLGATTRRQPSDLYCAVENVASALECGHETAAAEWCATAMTLLAVGVPPTLVSLHSAVSLGEAKLVRALLAEGARADVMVDSRSLLELALMKGACDEDETAAAEADAAEAGVACTRHRSDWAGVLDALLQDPDVKVPWGPDALLDAALARLWRSEHADRVAPA